VKPTLPKLGRLPHEESEGGVRARRPVQVPRRCQERTITEKGEMEERLSGRERPQTRAIRKAASYGPRC
jgi:hypothetical protein